MPTNPTTDTPVNAVVLRGRLAKDPSSHDLRSGEVLVRYEVTIPRPGGGADTVPVVWIGPPRSRPAPDRAGTEVLVLGRVQRRFWRYDGLTRSSTEVAAEHLVHAADRRRANSLRRKLGSLGAA